MRTTAFLVVLSVLLIAPAVQAVVPGLINYQGTLTDDNGVALDTTVAMIFTIYYDSTGAASIWTETQPAVEVTSGIFNVLLGSVNPISEGLFGGSPSRWLGVQVGGDPELTPRQRIVTVAHAFHAAVAETANYALNAPVAGDGDWTIVGNDMYSAVSGDVGIGTTVPAAPLHIDSQGNTELRIEHDDVENTISFYASTNKTGYISKDDDSEWLGFSADGSNDHMIIRETTGNVGIGTLAPSHPLHVVNPSNVNFSRAIYGASTSTGTGQQIWGVAGEVNTSTFGNAGAGVYGFASNATGAACGIRGEAVGENGRGVRAWATHTTGENYGIYAETSSPNGYAGYFRGGMNYFDGDVGIGVTYPSHALDVAGDINANGTLHLNGFSVLRRSFTNNLMVGRGAGENNTGDHNTFVGDSTGVKNQDDGNTFLGTWAGRDNTTGLYNTFLGMGAGYENSTGDFNTCVGVSAGGDITSGFSNVCLGYNSGTNITTGDLNVCLGNYAGYNNSTGNSNVFIGLQAGYNETGSDKLYIANGPNESDVLIYGNFSTGLVGIGTTSPTDDLEVVGEVDITSAVNTQVLDVYSTAYTSGQMVNVQTTQDVVSSGDLLQLKMGSTSSATCQFIECERGADVEFKVEGDGNVYADGTLHTPADFSEMIAVSPGASTVEPGDVIVIDPASLRAAVRSSQPRSTLVAGIYSTKPGVLGSERDWDKPVKGEDEERGTYTMEEMAAQFNEVPLAVVGIVPCKVSAENGAIRPGDLLVTSATPGHAMRDADPRTGTVVAKALESLGSGTGVIKVLVTLQ